MQKTKSEKGITILVLAITVIVLILITVPVVIRTKEISDLQKYTYFKADIDRLREAIEVVYLNETDLSSIGPEYTRDKGFLSKNQKGDTVRNPNDGDKYYIIQLSKLNSYINAQIELNYGEGNSSVQKDTNDVYIINESTRTIYYVQGLEYKEVIYYRLPEKFTELPSVYTVTYDANGGKNAPDMVTVQSTGTEIITFPAGPTRTGKTFVGWEDPITGEIYNVGQSYTVKSSIRFIAKWE